MINSVCRVVRVSTKNSLDGHLLNLATISPIYLYEVFRVLDVMKQICTFSSMKLQSLPILSKCLSFARIFCSKLSLFRPPRGIDCQSEELDALTGV